MAMELTPLKVLCIGNSFSEDTSGHAAKIAKSLGRRPLMIANLYIAGCPIDQHLENLRTDCDDYRYDYHDGTRWQSIPHSSIKQAILRDTWDWISIQHGSGNGVRYTDPSAYRQLSTLADEVRALAGESVKIAFNMAWVGEHDYDHHEIQFYGGNTGHMYRELCKVMQTVVVKNNSIDRVIPTGTAIQNARTTPLCKRLCRDGYHLSYDVGRYTAGLAFVCTLTGDAPSDVKWKPQGVEDRDRHFAVLAAKAALTYPFGISHIET